MGSISTRIQSLTPTEAELWDLAGDEGFEPGESIMQITPDPSMPEYCAAVYGTLGLEAIHVGGFKVGRCDDGSLWLDLKVHSEIEGPLLATCPVSLLDSVPPADPEPGSYSLEWRKRCRDFDLMRQVAVNDTTRLTVLRNLATDGRLVISHIR